MVPMSRLAAPGHQRNGKTSTLILYTVLSAVLGIGAGLLCLRFPGVSRLLFALLSLSLLGAATLLWLQRKSVRWFWLRASALLVAWGIIALLTVGCGATFWGW